MFKHLSFTGQSGCYGELPLAVLAGAETFTIEFKLSTKSTKNVTATYSGHPSCWEMGTIFGREISGFGCDDGGLVVNNGKLIFWASPASKGTGTSNTQVVSSNAVVNDGAVHKVAVVSSNGAIDLYCDDSLIAHTDNVNAKISAAQTILLGYNTNNNSYLQMDLFEARFWNVARTQAELFADIQGDETGLQGWYLPSVEGLKDYSGNNYHATLYGSPAYYDTLIFDADFELDIANATQKWKWSRLVSWLPFDTSPTLDKKGNTWTATGSPTAVGSELQLDGASYLQMTGGITLGGKDFTIRGKFNMSADSGTSCRIFSFHDANQTTTNCINLARYRDTANLYTDCMSSASSNVAISLNQTHDFEYNYYHDTGTVKIFIDGVLGITLSKTIPRTNFPNVFINKSNWSADGYFVGTIDEFQIYDGVALHTGNFAPPTADDYIELAFGGGETTAGFAFENDFILKWQNSRYIEDLIINDDLTAWLPFTDYPTEDYCGNWWVTTTSETVIKQKLIGIERDDNHEVALYLTGAADTQRGQLCLNCQGMYLGGRDFTVTFDWWYGGSDPLTSNYPIGFFGSVLGDISIRNEEFILPNANKISLVAFEQSTHNQRQLLTWRMWHSMRLEYSHANSKLKLLADDEVKGELDITIPRTFFPEVEVDRAGQDAGTWSYAPHGSGYISNLIIKGGDMAAGCGEVIWLAVFKNGQSTLYPFRPFEIVSYLAMAIRYDQRNWYNVLRELNDDRASDYDILYKGTAYALTKG